jgi:hypothetical protein
VQDVLAVNCLLLSGRGVHELAAEVAPIALAALEFQGERESSVVVEQSPYPGQAAAHLFYKT